MAFLLAAGGLLWAPTTALAAPKPVPAPPPAEARPPPAPVTSATLPALGEPQDRPFPGLITLTVDATDLDHHAFHVAESIPVRGAGDLVLLLPKWLPGNHAPTGPVGGLAGLSFRADGRPLAWTRDPVETYAFHVAAPSGASMVEVNFDLVTPIDPGTAGWS